MAPRSGLSAYIGFGKEVTPGVPVMPTLFLPLVSESLTLERERLESEAIIAGRRVIDSNQWNGGVDTVAGDIGLELTDTGLGLLFRQMFGGVASSGAGPTYQHVFTPGDLDGKTLTTQVIRPGVDGSYTVFTYGGCKFTSWEIGLAAGEIGTLGLSTVAMSEQAGTRVVTDGATTSGSATISSATGAFTAADIGLFVTGTGIPAGTRIRSITSATQVVLTANASATGSGVTITIGSPTTLPTYPSVKPLKFNHGTVLLDGTAIPVKSCTISGDNGLADDRRFIGSTGIAEALEQDLRVYEGTLDVEFSGPAHYRRFLAGTEHALALNLTSGAHSVNLATNVRFDGATPEVGGRELLEQSIPVKCVGPGTDAAAITATLVNAEATI